MLLSTLAQQIWIEVFFVYLSVFLDLFSQKNFCPKKAKKWSEWLVMLYLIPVQWPMNVRWSSPKSLNFHRRKTVLQDTSVTMNMENQQLGPINVASLDYKRAGKFAKWNNMNRIARMNGFTTVAQFQWSSGKTKTSYVERNAKIKSQMTIHIPSVIMKFNGVL